jgi:bifunctional oligoribonuclease and PAP phosphatase NrnA
VTASARQAQTVNRTATDPPLQQIVDAIRSRRRFVVTSHARPDGDAIGSAMAMAYALADLGKDVRVVSRDPVPPQFETCPGVDRVIVADHVEDPGDAVIVMECGDLTRPGIAGLDRGFVVNIDHHPGNTMYGALNWFDVSAAACGEMVFDLVRALDVRLTREIATHVYVAVLTDTGSFHYSNITPRTFEIARRCTEAGVDPAAIARDVYDSNGIGRLKLFRAVLNGMQLDATERVATMAVTRQMASDCGATYEDTEGLVNFPLSAKEVLAVVFFKENADGDWRISLRSKGAIDVNAVAKEFGGGGHKNASGCGVRGTFEQWKPIFEQKVTAAIDALSTHV